MAESSRKLKHAFVAVEPHHVSCAVEHGSAMLAVLEVSLHCGTQFGIDFTVEVIRHLLPDMFAINYHGFVPFSNGKRLKKAPPKPGARRSRSIRRARRSRVFTEAREMPSASAVSSMLRC